MVWLGCDFALVGLGYVGLFVVVVCCFCFGRFLFWFYFRTVF